MNENNNTVSQLADVILQKNSIENLNILQKNCDTNFLDPEQYFNLIVGDPVNESRALEYTIPQISELFGYWVFHNIRAMNIIIGLPTIWIPEIHNIDQAKQELGYIKKIKNIHLTTSFPEDYYKHKNVNGIFTFESEDISTFKLENFYKNLHAFDILIEFEVRRTHWAIKQGNLETLLKKYL